jgi:glycosyltransferase involved in cell wall biosynthesis
MGGDETYMRNVVRALGAVDPESDYTLFLNSPLPQDAIPGAERMRRVMVPPNNSRVPNPWSMALALARARIDVAHAVYIAPWPWPVRVVVSVHDIAYERYPQFFPPSMVTALRTLVPLTIHRAAAVLTLSEFSRRTIVRRYAVPPGKVVVAPCAADPMFCPIRDEARLAEARERYATGERFILCVSNLEPRKNLKTLMAAYVKLRQAGAMQHKLVLVGRKAWLSDDIFAAARASGYADDLVFTGYVPEEDLVALYNAADLLVYPSIVEAFGLPPLEAMACGTPVITSNAAALPEVVGHAALTVDPLDAHALAGSIAAVLANSGLRQRLCVEGPQRAATFSWEATARIIRDVYHRVVPA